MSNLRRTYLFALLFNIAIAALTVFGTLMVLTDLSFPWSTQSESPSEFFSRYSNIANLLYGSASLITIPFLLFGMITNHPFPKGGFLDQLKFVLSVNLLLVLFVSLVYLVPVSSLSDTFWNQNHLFFRLVLPLLAFFNEVLFENRVRIPFSHLFYSLIPIGCYSLFYIVYILVHYSNNEVSPEYDFYGFVQPFGVGFGLVVFFLVLLSTVILAMLVYYLRNRMRVLLYGYEPEEGEPLKTTAPKSIIAEEEDNEEIVSDEVLGHLGDEDQEKWKKLLASPEKKKDGPTSDTMEIILTYATDTGAVHNVKKLVHKQKGTFAPEENIQKLPDTNKVYHIYRKPFSCKWELRASGDEKGIGLYHTPAEALEEARKRVQMRGGSIMAHYTRFSAKAY
ncbi:MAG: DUF2188 domain-containing protein [Eubacteriales bacterium]|nr:DUF2188 domain-containing protein [Eubacteriales bacterium]